MSALRPNSPSDYNVRLSIIMMILSLIVIVSTAGGVWYTTSATVSNHSVQLSEMRDVPYRVGAMEKTVAHQAVAIDEHAKTQQSVRELLGRIDERTVQMAKDFNELKVRIK